MTLRKCAFAVVMILASIMLPALSLRDGGVAYGAETGKRTSKSDAPVEEGKGIRIRTEEEIKAAEERARQPFLKTVEELVNWLLTRGKEWFFLGMIVAATFLLTIFQKIFAKYMPKARFSGTVFTKFGAFVISIVGLAFAGFGVLALLGQRIPDLKFANEMEGLITIGCGLLVFVLGFMVGRGYRSAAALVIAILAFDVGRNVVARETLSEIQLTGNWRCFGESLMLVMMVMLFIAIRRRWKQITALSESRHRV